LFGRKSPGHGEEQLKQAEELAAEVLRSDAEVRYAALMACRARLLVAADIDSDEKWKVWDTMEWMSTACELPPDEADPASIRQLVDNLQRLFIKNI